MSKSDLSDFYELRQGFIPPIQKMKNGLGRNVNAGLKPHAQNVEALRADERVEFTLAPDASAGVRLSRTEAGIYPADLRMKNGLGHDVNGSVFVLCYNSRNSGFLIFWRTL